MLTCGGRGLPDEYGRGGRNARQVNSQHSSRMMPRAILICLSRVFPGLGEDPQSFACRSRSRRSARFFLGLRQTDEGRGIGTAGRFSLGGFPRHARGADVGD